MFLTIFLKNRYLKRFNVDVKTRYFVQNLYLTPFKPVKSDRINALRKQYDAFIEEDKKRKERNDYILGRLDKMRLCTAVVPLHNRINNRQTTAYPASGIMQENVLATNQLSRPNEELLPFNESSKHLNETFLLKEISKKYILIPKLRPTKENNNHHTAMPTQEDNIDWKSKYDILDKLKRDEKEESTDNYNSEFFAKPDAVVKENNEIRRQDKLLLFDYKDEVPEKDLSENKIDPENNPTITNINEICAMEPLDSDLEDKTNTTNSEPVKTPETSIGYKMHNESNVVSNMSTNNNTESLNIEDVSKIEGDNNYAQNIYPENFHNNDEMINNVSIPYQGQDEPMPFEQYTPIVEEKEKINAEQIQYPHFENTNYAQVLTSDKFVNEIKDEVANDQETFRGDSKEIENIVNNQDLETTNEKIQDGISINTGGQMADKGNVEPTLQYDEPIIGEVTENTADVAGIEEFDAEQREMFYSDQTDENYEAYNQEAVYNTEYTTQNENYEQNNQYPYYEGTQQEAYPTEINEHEETPQHYEQNYEQQYDKSYEPQAQEDPQQMVQVDPEMYDENKQEFDEHQQGYDENQQGYDENEQAYNQYEYEQQTNETVQQVEQQLDYEQGYAEEEQNRAVEESFAIPTDQEQLAMNPVAEIAQNKP